MARNQIVVSFNLEQVADIEAQSGIEVRNSSDLKRAIAKLIAIAPNGKAGNPKFQTSKKGQS